MSKRSVITDEDGHPTHIRETNDDGTQSRLYEYDDSFFGRELHDNKGNCIEVADHHEDGTTTAYKHSDSYWDHFWNDDKGEKK